VDAHRRRGLDFYGQILLWPPKYAHEWPCKRRGWNAQMLKGPRPSVCTINTRWSRRRRTPKTWFGLLWPDTSMATRVRARVGSTSSVIGMHKCGGDPRRRFAPSTPGVRVVDAHRRRGLDFYGRILLWSTKSAHEWAVQVARLGCTNVGGTPAVGVHPPHTVLASWTHTVGVVWTSMARYFYGHPSTRTNGPCK